MTAALVGYDPQHSGGVFTFGGTGTLLYGVKVGLEKACPGTVHSGLREPAVSSVPNGRTTPACTVANWLGMGDENVIQVPTTAENELRPCLLESHGADRARKRAKRSPPSLPRWARPTPLAWTTSTRSSKFATSWCGVLARLSAACPCRCGDRLGLERFQRLRFSGQSPRLSAPHGAGLAGAHGAFGSLGQADSIGVDFHKTGFTPYVSSLFLFARCGRFRADRPRATHAMPYLFQSGHYHPGKFTLETTRGGSGPLAAMANLLLFGKDGLRSLLGHLVTMAEILRDQLNGHPATTVLNRAASGRSRCFGFIPTASTRSAFPNAKRPTRLSRRAAKTQRLQPPHLRAGAGRRAGRAGDRDLDDRLLSPHPTTASRSSPSRATS